MDFLIAIGLFAVAGVILRTQREQHMDISRLTAAVEALSTVGESVGATIDNLVNELRANAGDQAAINELADRLEAERAEIVAAIQRGTIAEDEEPGEDTQPGEDTTGGDTTTEPGGEDTVAGGQGEDTLQG